ncbi:hypothetical protein V9T40_013112 [Parthenolecanium corni]|uniref:Uncharacterized protein n=1 Tax=Parthenolecanium corni TaxID=536013 RepID=A0AAN9Y6L3_9HEMI
MKTVVQRAAAEADAETDCVERNQRRGNNAITLNCDRDSEKDHSGSTQAKSQERILPKRKIRRYLHPLPYFSALPLPVSSISSPTLYEYASTSQQPHVIKQLGPHRTAPHRTEMSSEERKSVAAEDTGAAAAAAAAVASTPGYDDRGPRSRLSAQETGGEAKAATIRLMARTKSKP